jgi:glycosyltransferase involved in cell wall biosynthesis
VTRRLDIVLAAEALVPRLGGSERFALELLRALSARHRVRALVIGEPEWVAAWERFGSRIDVIQVVPPLEDGDGRWRRRLRRGRRMREAVTEHLRANGGDVVIGQLLVGAGAVAAARDVDVKGAVLLSGYEALCHWAFKVGSSCRPETRCRGCPSALALPAGEREDLWRVRAEQDASLATADLLVAPSEAVAGACERIAGRRPCVAAPVVGAPGPARARPDGHVLFVSSVWAPEKGSDLLVPIASRLPHRHVLVQAPNGLPGETRRGLARLTHVEVREADAEIDELLDGAGLLLVPSQLPEPFGRVAFEGLAAGVPTLASATGGLKEFVPPVQLVQPPDDPGAWASAVRALEQRDAWQRARSRGKEAAREVLAGDPAGRIERWLLEATAVPVAPD